MVNFNALQVNDYTHDKMMDSLNTARTKLHENKGNNEKLKEIAEDFSSLFVKMMLDQMRSTLNPEEDPLFGGQTEMIWQDMLYDEYSKSMAKNGLNSISEMVYKSLLDNEEKSGNI